MSKKHRRSKKKSQITSKKTLQQSNIPKKETLKSETSLQELINTNIKKEKINQLQSETTSNKKFTSEKKTPNNNITPISLNNSKNKKLTQKREENNLTVKKETSKKESPKITTTNLFQESATTKISDISKQADQKINEEKKEIKNNIETKPSTNKSHSKFSTFVISILTIILLSLISILTYFSINYYQMINNNNQLLQEITNTNTKISNTELSNNEINTQIEDKEKQLKDKIKEYNIWIKTKEKIEKALS